MDESRLCFGNLCNIVRAYSRNTLYLKEGWKKTTQDSIIRLLYECVEDVEVVATCLDESGSNASKIFNCKGKANYEIVQKILNKDNEIRILKYIKEHICPSVSWDELIQHLVKYCGQVKNFAREVDVSAITDDLDIQMFFFLRCLQYAAKEKNDYLSSFKIREDKLVSKYDKMATKFSNANRLDSKEKAVCIQLEGDCLKTQPYNIESGIIVFHHFEEVLQFILLYGLILVRIRVVDYMIRVIVRSENYTLKRIPRQEYNNLIGFIEPYVEKFEPKYSWKGRDIAQLAKAGFDKNVYLPYGYYDKTGKIIGFCDYKIHRDDVELGILLVREEDREQGIANSLLLFFRLMFFNSRLFTGTHEENGRMQSALSKAGFKEMIFLTDENGAVKGTNKKKDRIREDKPYSLYYIADPLLH